MENTIKQVSVEFLYWKIGISAYVVWKSCYQISIWDLLMSEDRRSGQSEVAEEVGR